MELTFISRWVRVAVLTGDNEKPEIVVVNKGGDFDPVDADDYELDLPFGFTGKPRG